jgi:hypothetical protein
VRGVERRRKGVGCERGEIREGVGSIFLDSQP